MSGPASISAANGRLTRRRTVALYRYRCTRDDCRMRQTLPKPVEHYRKPRRCHCGGRLALDQWRHRFEVGRRTRSGICLCHGYPFPHRQGSLWCNHHPTGPDEHAMRERYGQDCFEEIRP